MGRKLDFYAMQEEVYLNNMRLNTARVAYTEEGNGAASGVIRVNQFEGIDALRALTESDNQLHILIYDIAQERVQKDFEDFRVTHTNVSLPDAKGVQHTHIHFEASAVDLWDRSPARVRKGIRWTIKAFMKLFKEAVRWK